MKIARTHSVRIQAGFKVFFIFSVYRIPWEPSSCLTGIACTVY
jgi:hypothetical protein